MLLVRLKKSKQSVKVPPIQSRVAAHWSAELRLFKLSDYLLLNAELKRKCSVDYCILLLQMLNTKFSNSQTKTNLMQQCEGFISAESLYRFRAQAPIIRSI
jgi:hypothetical protein